MSTQPILHPPKPGFLLLEVVYGLVSRNCRGMGICKLEKATTTSRSTTASPCGSSMAWAGLNEEGCFELLVIQSTVNAVQWERRFSQGAFVLEEAFDVPEELFGQAIGILAGRYPVQEVGNHLRICFG